MTDEDKKLLEDNGWNILCESPFEIEYWEDGDGNHMATGIAADIVLQWYRECNG